MTDIDRDPLDGIREPPYLGVELIQPREHQRGTVRPFCLPAAARGCCPGQYGAEVVVRPAESLRDRGERPSGPLASRGRVLQLPQGRNRHLR